jgi:hypothetical protein
MGGSEPTLVGLGGGGASGLTLPLPSTVTLAESTSGDVDPFLVQIDQDDPNHPRVRFSHLFLFLATRDLLTILGNVRLEPFERARNGT